MQRTLPLRHPYSPSLQDRCRPRQRLTRATPTPPTSSLTPTASRPERTRADGWGPGRSLPSPSWSRFPLLTSPLTRPATGSRPLSTPSTSMEDHKPVLAAVRPLATSRMLRGLPRTPQSMSIKHPMRTSVTFTTSTARSRQTTPHRWSQRAGLFARRQQGSHSLNPKSRFSRRWPPKARACWRRPVTLAPQAATSSADLMR